MLSNLFAHVTLVLQKLLILYLLLILRTYSEYITNFLDYFSRLSCSDSSLLLYHFIWTQSFYINTVFLIMAYVLLVFKTYLPNYTSKILIVILTIILVYLKLHYFTLNTSFMMVSEVSVSTNELLTNNLNKVHPAILYFTVISTLTNTAPKLQFFAENKVQLSYIILTLTLGSWWAFQEGSWGGWWNWDPSETLGLTVMLLFLWLQHQNPKVYSNWSRGRVWGEWLLVLTLTYLLTQLGFALISHNFSELVIKFSNPDLIRLLLVLLIGNRWLTSQRIRLGVSQHSLCMVTLHKVVTQNKLTLLFTHTLITYVVLLSFKLLMNDFVWRLLKLNLLNYTLPLHKLLTGLLVLTLAWSWVPLKLISATGPATLVLSFPTMAISALIRMRVNVTNLLHFSLILSIFINLECLLRTILRWSLTANSLDSRCFIVSEANYMFNLTPSNSQIAKFELTRNNTFVSNFNLLTDSLNKQLHMFFCSASSDQVVQSLLVGTYLYTHAVSVYEQNLVSIFSIVFITVSLLTVILFKPKVILF